MHCTNTVNSIFFIISFKRRQVHVFTFTDICLSKKHLGLSVVRFYHQVSISLCLIVRDLLILREKFIVLYVLEF